MIGLDVVFGLLAAVLVGGGVVPRPTGAAAVTVPAPSPRDHDKSFSVTPGGAGTPLAALPKGRTPQLVWTGFQVTGSGSRVFVQITHDVQLDVQTVKGGLTVTLRNCRIHARNNSRTLDTRFFATPVKQVEVHQRKRGVELDIALKEPAAATPRKESGPGGSQFWVLDFAPSETKKTPATASAE